MGSVTKTVQSKAEKAGLVFDPSTPESERAKQRAPDTQAAIEHTYGGGGGGSGSTTIDLHSAPASAPSGAAAPTVEAQETKQTNGTIVGGRGSINIYGERTEHTVLVRGPPPSVQDVKGTGYYAAADPKAIREGKVQQYQKSGLSRGVAVMRVYQEDISGKMKAAYYRASDPSVRTAKDVAQTVGYGAVGFATGAFVGAQTAIVHPWQTIKGTVSMLRHPVDSTKHLASQGVKDPFGTAGEIFGVSKVLSFGTKAITKRIPVKVDKLSSQVTAHSYTTSKKTVGGLIGESRIRVKRTLPTPKGKLITRLKGSVETSLKHTTQRVKAKYPLAVEKASVQVLKYKARAVEATPGQVRLRKLAEATKQKIRKRGKEFTIHSEGVYELTKKGDFIKVKESGSVKIEGTNLEGTYRRRGTAEPATIKVDNRYTEISTARLATRIEMARRPTRMLRFRESVTRQIQWKREHFRGRFEQHKSIVQETLKARTPVKLDTIRSDIVGRLEGAKARLEGQRPRTAKASKTVKRSEWVTDQYLEDISTKPYTERVDVVKRVRGDLTTYGHAATDLELPVPESINLLNLEGKIVKTPKSTYRIHKFAELGAEAPKEIIAVKGAGNYMVIKAPKTKPPRSLRGGRFGIIGTNLGKSNAKVAPITKPKNNMPFSTLRVTETTTKQLLPTPSLKAVPVTRVRTIPTIKSRSVTESREVSRTKIAENQRIKSATDLASKNQAKFKIEPRSLTEVAPAQKSASSIKSGQRTRQTTMPETDQLQRVIPRQTTRTPPEIPPPVPPPTPRIIITPPPVPSSRPPRMFRGRQRSVFMPKAYKPSIASGMLGIRGTPTKLGIKSGLSIRPLPRKKKVKI